MWALQLDPGPRGGTKPGSREESQQNSPHQPDGPSKSPGQFPTLS